MTLTDLDFGSMILIVISAVFCIKAPCHLLGRNGLIGVTANRFAVIGMMGPPAEQL